MMRRKLFFWLEKLKIAPSERKAISGLMIVLSVLAVSNLVFSSPEPFGDEQYAELEKQFRERTAQLKAEQAKLMDRYNPPEKKALVATAVADTVPADTTDDEEPESTKKETDQPQNERINVNTADQELLKTLPGIGPAYSKRIIDYRQKHDGFKTIEELKKIKGIGEKRLEKLKPFVKLKDS